MDNCSSTVSFNYVNKLIYDSSQYTATLNHLNIQLSMLLVSNYISFILLQFKDTWPIDSELKLWLFPTLFNYFLKVTFEIEVEGEEGREIDKEREGLVSGVVCWFAH